MCARATTDLVLCFHRLFRTGNFSQGFGGGLGPDVGQRAPRRRSKGRQGGPSRRKNKGRRGRAPRCKIKGRRGGTKCRRNPSRQKAGGNGCATGGSQAHQG